ncbi:hypothetical protein CLPU_3c02320 [Gottschalkia purinilytica]|uniref:Uncharacterized protein n=1 Tax=Gottschalkia purinilytica TaxID=1503 RepID=A0A0L0WDA3_GOTPU|nr:hypothetical protein [Gottschalkia purinilytica]KNF09453.1 hypothetical protein CLPU_3c02320 [Gottschalkia purinilytica]
MKNTDFKNILSNWISQISNEEDLDENIKALNFGIFESENGYTVYLIGSNEYDIDDDEWACNEDFVPKQKYLTFNEGQTIRLNWEDFEELICRTLKSIINSEKVDEYSILNVDNITTGFDDGDLIKIK